jgi:hypothetical protein
MKKKLVNVEARSLKGRDIVLGGGIHQVLLRGELFELPCFSSWRAMKSKTTRPNF